MHKLFRALRALLCVYLSLSFAACPHLCFDSHLRVGGVCMVASLTPILSATCNKVMPFFTRHSLIRLLRLFISLTSLLFYSKHTYFAIKKRKKAKKLSRNVLTDPHACCMITYVISKLSRR